MKTSQDAQSTVCEHVEKIVNEQLCIKYSSFTVIWLPASLWTGQKAQTSMEELKWQVLSSTVAMKVTLKAANQPQADTSTFALLENVIHAHLIKAAESCFYIQRCWRDFFIVNIKNMTYCLAWPQRDALPQCPIIKPEYFTYPTVVRNASSEANAKNDSERNSAECVRNSPSHSRNPWICLIWVQTRHSHSGCVRPAGGGKISDD